MLHSALHRTATSLLIPTALHCSAAHCHLTEWCSLFCLRYFSLSMSVVAVQQALAAVQAHTAAAAHQALAASLHASLGVQLPSGVIKQHGQLRLPTADGSWYFVLQDQWLVGACRGAAGHEVALLPCSIAPCKQYYSLQFCSLRSIACFMQLCSLYSVWRHAALPAPCSFAPCMQHYQRHAVLLPVCSVAACSIARFMQPACLSKCAVTDQIQAWVRRSCTGGRFCRY